MPAMVGVMMSNLVIKMTAKMQAIGRQYTLRMQTLDEKL